MGFNKVNKNPRYYFYLCIKFQENWLSTFDMRVAQKYTTSILLIFQIRLKID